jgi:hypothetical protein
MDMKDQRFGVEIELTGLSRQKAGQILVYYFNAESYHTYGYDTYSVLDSQNRSWKVMSDGSIHAECINGTADDTYKVEFVTPICEYDDIPTIQKIVRNLRHAGAIANNNCGIHVHVDASPHNANTLRNITNIMASKEDLIYKTLQVEVAREHDYCRKVDMRFLEELNRKKPRTLDEVSRIWYDGSDRSHIHYDDSRYHCLNLHSVFQKGTIEFRLFNSTTHAGRVKSYVQFCLAISHQALTQRCASRAKTHSTNEKYTFRTWLLRLGLIGDEYKTARLHLLENLDGCIAWKDPAQAERQRERIRQKREKETQARAIAAAAAQTEPNIESHDEAGAEEESSGLSLSL